MDHLNTAAKGPHEKSTIQVCLMNTVLFNAKTTIRTDLLLHVLRQFQQKKQLIVCNYAHTYRHETDNEIT